MITLERLKEYLEKHEWHMEAANRDGLVYFVEPRETAKDDDPLEIILPKSNQDASFGYITVALEILSITGLYPEQQEIERLNNETHNKQIQVR